METSFYGGRAHHCDTLRDTTHVIRAARQAPGACRARGADNDGLGARLRRSRGADFAWRSLLAQTFGTSGTPLSRGVFWSRTVEMPQLLGRFAAARVRTRELRRDLGAARSTTWMVVRLNSLVRLIFVG